MGIEFNRIITLLRKERGITQKQAAQDLGISQAQLSHYEKGIRECGLAFVVQVADYYDVSCDYLLGRSADAAMSMAEGDLAAALTGEDGTRDSLEPATLALSTDQLARDYPRHATSLFNLVKNAEEAMRGLKKAE